MPPDARDHIARWLASTLCVLSLTWAAAIPLSARVRSDASAHPAVAVLAAVPYAIGRLVCHQRPERSFNSGAAQWPVCGRCTGIYLSAAIGIMALAMVGGAIAPAPSSAPRTWRTMLVVAALPTIASFALERAGWTMPTSATRAWLAVPFGAVVGALLACLALERQATRKT